MSIVLGCFEKTGCQRIEDSFGVTYGENVLQIINEEQNVHMILGILLLLGRGKKIILGIIVDHSLGKDLIVLNTEVKSVKFNLHKGENFTTDSQFYESRTPYDVIYTNPYLCRCLRGEVILELKLQYDCGYAPIEKNSGLVTGRSNYFPCFTDYSLQEYVRILPMDPAGDARTIPIRYYNGFTKEQFQTLLKSWLAIAKRDKREEEQKWLEKYPDMA